MPVILSKISLHPTVSKWGAVALIATAVALIAWSAVTNPRMPLDRWWREYERILDQKLRWLFLTTRPSSIVIAQAILLLGVGGLTALIPFSYVCALALVVVFFPSWYLKRLRKKRLRALQAQIEPFLLAL